MTMADSVPDYKLKVFLGGLSFETDDTKIREHFCQFGNITDIIIMRDPMTSKSRGFGFITYDEPRSVDAVMENRPHMLDGRDVEPKRAIPREKQTGPTGGMAGKITKVFVGGIKDQTTESDLQSYFSQYGAIDGVELVRDRETQKKRGFAFVNFLEWEAVDKACEMKYHNVNGVQVELKKARTKSELITGNFAGEVRNTNDIAQQLTQYNNLSYSQGNNHSNQNGQQLYGQQQQFGQQLYNQQVAYNQQGYNQQNQFQNYGYGYDYQAMYGGLVVPATTPSSLDTAATDMGVVQSAVPPGATGASTTTVLGVTPAVESMDNNAFSVPPPMLIQTLHPGMQAMQTLPPGMQVAPIIQNLPQGAPVTNSLLGAMPSSLDSNAANSNQMGGQNNQMGNQQMMSQVNQMNNQQNNQQHQQQQQQPWDQNSQQQQTQSQQQFNSNVAQGNNQIVGNNSTSGQQNAQQLPNNGGNQWSNNSQSQKSFGSNYDSSYSGGPQRGSNFNQKSSGPYGGGYGQNSQSTGSGDANYARR